VAKIEQVVDLLDEYVFPSTHPVSNWRFHRGISREIDTLLVSNELADPILFQETLPMLRIMCVRETINKMIADSLKENNEPTHKSKRKTRNSRGAQHCLERISPMFRTPDEEGLTSWDFGEKLSYSCLSYVNRDRIN
jgi:hypothetical protein